MEYCLECRDLSKRFGAAQALDGVNLMIQPGRVVGLLGPNGSGKTTLSRLFMALDHPRSGQILVDGEDIINYEPADLADKVGYVFQNPDLQILADTVYEEVAYGPRVKKLPEENIKTNVKAALRAMGLNGLEAKYPRILSFGQKRRLGVAAALALNPRMLILDEITNGQDAAEQAAMLKYLKALNEEKGTTIILITHDMDVVRQYAKRAIVLTDGRLVFSGTPQELFEGQHPVEMWGLRRPPVSVLASALGVSAATCDEFCDAVVKGGAPA